MVLASQYSSFGLPEISQLNISLDFGTEKNCIIIEIFDLIVRKELLTMWDSIRDDISSELQICLVMNMVRDSFKKFITKCCNKLFLISVLDYSSHDIFGDILQSLILVQSYYKQLVTCGMFKLLSTQAALEKKIMTILFHEVYNALIQYIDAVFSNAVVGCYTKFYCITELLLNHNEIKHLIRQYKADILEHYILMKNCWISLGGKD